MELKDIVIMDITEAFATTTSPDQELSKSTDFFDFVSHPDPSNLQDFQKQMRNVNVFLDNGTEDHKETNNNNNMLISEIPTATSDGSLFDATLWNEKDTVRLETAILEDLNKYCWQNDEINGVVQIKPHSTHNNNNNNNNNTDGQIYTLTVLNGLDQNTTWYRPPLNVKEEEVSMSSPSTMEQLQTNLDIDSFLNIIPSGQITGYSHSYNEETMSPNTDGLIKSETYTYEDSGFADNKEELANQLMEIDTPLLEAHDSFNNNNNNNDWKLTNNNNTHASSTAESLLRNALQGKAFVRYNGAAKTSNGPKVIVENNNVELKRVLSSPTKTETIFIGKDDAEQQHIPTIVAAINANGKVVFEEQGAPQRHIEMIDTTSSSHSMDDILLSQLDHPFEDFEKLKRIANEVAESVNQYCIESTPATVGSTVQASISSDDIGLLYNINTPMPTNVAPIVTSTKPPTKKYKRSNSTKSNTTTVQSATSTSNGAIRKERSLHYCSICSKGFKDKYSVNVHIRTHTGEKPFACSLCGKTFRQKAHLAKHYQTHIAQKNAAAAGNGGSAKARSR